MNSCRSLVQHPAGIMGIWISRLMAVFGEKEARILVLGLDNAGKTTILCERPGHTSPAKGAPHSAAPS